MPDNGIRVVKLFRQGNASVITIPAEFLRKLGARRGELMRLDYAEDSITVRKLDAPKIRLKRAPRVNGPGATVRGE